MPLKKEIEAILRKHRVAEHRWLDPREIVVAEWVRMKCRFGCGGYGKCAVCPPNVPPVKECARFFSEYRHAAILQFKGAVSKPENRHAWTRKINGNLLKLERDVFLAGHEKAFMLLVDPCNLCADCAVAPADCRNPKSARPAPEAFGVDVFSTARKCGFKIRVLKDYTEEMHRYAILLVE